MALKWADLSKLTDDYEKPTSTGKGSANELKSVSAGAQYEMYARSVLLNAFVSASEECGIGVDAKAGVSVVVGDMFDMFKDCYKPAVVYNTCLDDSSCETRYPWYHNFKHALDVLTMGEHFWNNWSTRSQYKATQLDHFVFLVACFGHDVAHCGGFNCDTGAMLASMNVDAIKSSAIKARLRNVKEWEHADHAAVMEYRHSALTQILASDALGVLCAKRGAAELKSQNKLIDDLILATCMGSQFGLSSPHTEKMLIASRLRENAKPEASDKVTVMQLMVHTADMSSQAQSAETSMRNGKRMHMELVLLNVAKPQEFNKSQCSFLWQRAVIFFWDDVIALLSGMDKQHQTISNHELIVLKTNIIDMMTNVYKCNKKVIADNVRLKFTTKKSDLSANDLNMNSFVASHS